MRRGSQLARRAGASPFTTMPQRTAGMPRVPWLSSRPGGSKPRPGPGHARGSGSAGFSAAVKLAIRRRAGSGDASEALCESCGIWLGLHGGEVQHIICRGSGGTSLPEINSVRNGTLLCGSGALRTGCHGKAEDRDPEMYERGFWRKHGEKVGACPLMLHGRDGGFTRWLTADGGYSAEPPQDGAA